MKVLVGGGVLLAIDFGDAAQQVAIGSGRLQGDDLIRFLGERAGIAVPDGNARQCPVRFDDIGTQANRIAPFRFRAVGIGQLVECQTELVVGDGAVDIGFRTACRVLMASLALPLRISISPL